MTTIPALRHVACAVLVRDGRVLLGKRSPHRRSYANCWDVIGGHLEAGETPVGALIREVREEIGLTPTRFAPLGTLAEPRPDLYGPATLDFFLVTEWTGGEPRMLGDEHTELGWFDIPAACSLPDLAAPGYRAIFESIGRFPGFE